VYIYIVKPVYNGIWIIRNTTFIVNTFHHKYKEGTSVKRKSFKAEMEIRKQEYNYVTLIRIPVRSNGELKVF